MQTNDNNEVALEQNIATVDTCNPLVEWHGDTLTGTYVSIRNYTDAELEVAWVELEDIPLIDVSIPDGRVVDALGIAWRGFPQGAEKAQVLNFFNKQHSKSINWLVNEYGKEDCANADADSDIEECTICKVEGISHAHDSTIWGCEKCGIDFCEACFSSKHGAEIAHEMFSMDGDIDDILCPTCFKNQSEDILKDIHERICRRCKSSVFISENPRYVYECRVCDEDLYSFETELRQPLVVGASEDVGHVSHNHVDVYCEACDTENYNVPTNQINRCYACGCEVFPCTGCDYAIGNGCDGEHAGDCNWDDETMRCNRFSHTKEFTEEHLEERAAFIRYQIQNTLVRNILEDSFNVTESADDLELETWTNGGVNMFIHIPKYEDIVRDFCEYVKYFDMDEEIELHRQDARYKAVFTLKQSVADFEGFVDKIEAVADKLEAIDSVYDIVNELVFRFEQWEIRSHSMASAEEKAETLRFIAKDMYGLLKCAKYDKAVQLVLRFGECLADIEMQCDTTKRLELLCTISWDMYKSLKCLLK